MNARWIIGVVVLTLTLGVVLLIARSGGGNQVDLLNVSYDPTRELWRDINRAFAADYEGKTGVAVHIQQSHGGSGSQARSVADGLEADVVTLALYTDTDALRHQGLLAKNWRDRLPENSLPYFSTIVFVVRRGNPKNIRDWPDLARGDVGVITPSPKTSGNGKLSFLAAWGSVRNRGGSDQDAETFVRKLYENVVVLDTGARGSTVTFARRDLGDVHLTWENEAHLEVKESRGELEVVYPPVSIKAEPFVAWVDGNVERKGTRAAAEAYLRFLYTDTGQEIIAKHYYRPIRAEMLAKFSDRFPSIKLFPVTSFARDWDDAQDRFFADGGVFDRIYQK
ncbi:MAG: sulfate ABC transporter substrate-binding protein [Planctomycetes bacterium]|nr:sulfate ABC transporter substrate-binding protein [Planctomycetota bacterium]